MLTPHTIRSTVAATTIVLTLAASVSAQDDEVIQLDSYEDLVARIESLESRRVSVRRPVFDGTLQSEGGWFAGYEAVIVKPVFSRNIAFVAEDTGLVTSTSAEGRKFDWAMEYSSRFELGYLSPSSNVGIRTRFWGFDSEASVVSNENLNISFADDPDIELDPGAGVTTVVNASSDLNVFDVEAISKRAIFRNVVTLGAGVRFAQIEHDFSATRLDNNERMAANNRFRGAGGTFSLSSRRALGNTGLGITIGSRASVLFGNSDFLITMDTDGDGIAEELFQDLDQTRVIPVGEFHAGFDYREYFGPGRVDLGVALESQFWLNGGTPAVSSGTGQSDAEAFIDPRLQDLGLIGLSIRGGYTY